MPGIRVSLKPSKQRRQVMNKQCPCLKYLARKPRHLRLREVCLN